MKIIILKYRKKKLKLFLVEINVRKIIKIFKVDFVKPLYISGVTVS